MRSSPHTAPHFFGYGGNLDFASFGTKYFTLTSVCTERPFTVCHDLGKYKFDLIEYGFDFSYFHCTKDNRHVRQRVFSIIKDDIALSAYLPVSFKPAYRLLQDT
ncbi:MAG: hypothetical protein D3903_22360 [Candidatus Electrothrix sp. GM3_4]|nr:hypothetical protein [Candidatus Electrothrix sp. GM3_4]